MKVGEKQVMEGAQAVMVIGEVLKNNAPYRNAAVNDQAIDEADAWGELAFHMVAKGFWSQRSLEMMVSYAMSNIDQAVEILEHGELIIVGGISKKTESGRKTLDELIAKYLDGTMKTVPADSIETVIEAAKMEAV